MSRRAASLVLTRSFILAAGVLIAHPQPPAAPQAPRKASKNARSRRRRSLLP
jgi:hypothetical protein